MQAKEFFSVNRKEELEEKENLLGIRRRSIARDPTL